MTIPSPYLLEALIIRKVFDDFVALDDVSLKLARGSFHALLGENGAGKSTLVKCIMGYYHPDGGNILLDNKEVSINNPRDAHNLGIGMVYQHFTLIPNMTVAENLILARPHLPAMIDWKSELAELETRMATMPFKVPLQSNINTLSAGEKQKVEIIKQLLLDSRLLILDEPTSVLTPNEADEVLGQIKGMVDDNGLSVLIITHKFREVTGFADEVTVLRRGKYVGSCKVAGTETKTMAAMMMGSEVIAEPLARAETKQNETLLEIDQLSAESSSGETAIESLSLNVRAGEIVGIAGVSGNGQRELVEVLAGQRDIANGSIRLHGETFDATRRQARLHNLHCLPEEPLKNACVPNMSVAENMAFNNFDIPPYALKGLLINRGRIRERARTLITAFKVRTETEDTRIGALSGGNVQRAVLARELSGDIDVLVVANPVFGLDFKAVEEIHNRIMAARNNGTAVLLVSEDLDELLELSDCIHVISSGKLVYQTTPAEADRSVIGQHMAGH